MSEQEETQKKMSGGVIAMLIILLVGLIAVGYLWSKENRALKSCELENKSLQADMDGMSNMMSGYSENMSNDLKADFQNMLDTYDKLKIKDVKQEDSINIQKAKIQNLLDELNSSKKISARQLYTMRKENETLRGIMKGYVKQIDSLNTLNLRLNTDLETRTSELNEASNERDQYKTESEIAAEKVKKGSKLQAYGFSSTGLRMKLNNTTDETNKARSTSMIKSSFTIGENTIATSGRKMVYMQIINPDGKTLQTSSNNTMQTDDGAIAYSDKKEIDYNNQSIDVAIFFNQSGKEFAKGTYKVKIFVDGQLIGTDSFTLK